MGSGHVFFESSRRFQQLPPPSGSFFVGKTCPIERCYGQINIRLKFRASPSLFLFALSPLIHPNQLQNNARQSYRYRFRHHLFVSRLLLFACSRRCSSRPHSCVGVWQNDRVEIIANDQGNRTTPSYVSFSDTERLIGDAAKNQVAMNPHNTYVFHWDRDIR